MKQLGVLLLLSQDGKLVYRRFPQHSVKLAHNLLVPICMPGLKPRPLDPKYIYILAHQYVIVPLHVVITFYIFSYVNLICRLAPLGVISLYVHTRLFTFQAGQNSWKYFSLNNHFSQVNRMLCNLAQCGKYVSLQKLRNKKIKIIIPVIIVIIIRILIINNFIHKTIKYILF